MTVFELKIKTDNHNFDDYPEELTRLLHDTACTLRLLRKEHLKTKQPIFDIEGNCVGYLTIMEE